MRIAFFSESFLPYVSGVTIAVDTLANDLRKLGHEVTIFAPSYPNQPNKEKDVVRFPSIPSSYPGFRLALRLFLTTHIPSFGKQNEFDIIHIHSPFQLGRLGRRIAKKYNIPLVLTLHTLFDQYLHNLPVLPKYATRPLLMRYLKRFYKSCNCIIIPSQRVAEEMKVVGRVEIITNGIAFEEIEKSKLIETRSKLGIPKDAKVLLYMGRLSKEKNLPFLFEVFQKLSAEFNNLYFLVIGGGPLEKQLRTSHLEHRTIIFTGQTPREQLFQYAKAADVFIFSSTTETQGLVIAEAKACGLPVVTVDDPAIRASVINNEDGFLVNENVDDFSAKVKLLLQDNTLREKMGRVAKENAQRDFSSIAVAKKHEAVYNSLIKGGIK